MNAMAKAFVQSGAMNNAFENIVIKEAVRQRSAELKDKGWSATLSYKTYQQLKAQGIMA